MLSKLGPRPTAAQLGRTAPTPSGEIRKRRDMPVIASRNSGYAGHCPQYCGICRPSRAAGHRPAGAGRWREPTKRPGRWSLHVQHRHHHAHPANVRRGPPGRGRLLGPLLGADPQELRERPTPVLCLVRLGRSRGLRHQAGPHRTVGPLHGGKGVWPGPPSGGGCRRWPASTGSACSTA